MSTRGLCGVVIDGEVKATYNHFDSYPSALGADIVSQIPRLDADKWRTVQLVSEDVPPTKTQQVRLAKNANTGVSIGDTSEWYVLLRDAQGNLVDYQEIGFMIDGSNFAQDSLFCEWAYLVNFDDNVLEIYKGFNKGNVIGRFEGPGSWNGEYSAISLIATFPLDDLPDMNQFETDFYDEDE